MVNLNSLSSVILMEANSTLEYYGTTSCVHYGSITMAAGASILLCSNTAEVPLYLGYMNGSLTANGTSGSHCTISTKAGSSGTWHMIMGSTYSLQRTNGPVTYLDFTGYRAQLQAAYIDYFLGCTFTCEKVMCLYASSTRMDTCTFTMDDAAAGIAVYYDARVTLTGCTINTTNATNNILAYYGGAITLRDCTFTGQALDPYTPYTGYIFVCERARVTEQGSLSDAMVCGAHPKADDIYDADPQVGHAITTDISWTDTGVADLYLCHKYDHDDTWTYLSDEGEGASGNNQQYQLLIWKDGYLVQSTTKWMDESETWGPTLPDDTDWTISERYLAFEADVEDDPSDQTFTITNSGSGTLSYTVADNQTWCSVSPASGSSTGEADTITVSIETSGLTAGAYEALITITDTDSTLDDAYVPVFLHMGGTVPTIADVTLGAASITEFETTTVTVTTTTTDADSDVFVKINDEIYECTRIVDETWRATVGGNRIGAGAHTVYVTAANTYGVGTDDGETLTITSVDTVIEDDMVSLLENNWDDSNTGSRTPEFSPAREMKATEHNQDYIVVRFQDRDRELLTIDGNLAEESVTLDIECWTSLADTDDETQSAQLYLIRDEVIRLLIKNRHQPFGSWYRVNVTGEDERSNVGEFLYTIECTIIQMVDNLAYD